MSLSRRGFVRALGLGTAGVLSSNAIIGRGLEAAAFEPEAERELWQQDGIIRISSNENARGPADSALRAIRDATNHRLGRYSRHRAANLASTIADELDTEDENVILATGSGSILEGATRHFTGPGRPLVTGEPSYGSPDRAARAVGAEIKAIPVTGSLQLDLGAMADAAQGAGMVFLCNPNNPTGTAHTASDVESFVRQVKRDSPDTAILIDEAYIDYIHGPDMATAAPLALELPGVFITRTFSKAHGMAGMRIGYAVGRTETVDAIAENWNLGEVNALSGAAGTASLKDEAHMAQERRTNARIRDFTLGAFRDMGYDGPDTHTNFIFVRLGIPASDFREACLDRGVRVGRDFPPMEDTHSRISLGTMEEMRKAVDVFREVLTS